MIDTVVANKKPFRLILSIAKTKVMMIAKKHTPIAITIKEEAVQQVTAFRCDSFQVLEDSG